MNIQQDKQLKKNDINLLDVRMVVAKNLQFYRNRANLTQAQVADLLGVTYQQIQKYEKGKNRIAAEVLYIMSRLYGVCMQQFFWDLSNCMDMSVPIMAPMLTETVSKK